MRQDSVTQAERNRKVHEEIVREYGALSQEERVQRLIDCGILTKAGKLAPRYGGPAEGPDEEQPPEERESKAS